MLARGRLEHGLEDRRLDVARDELVEDLEPVGLELGVAAARAGPGPPPASCGADSSRGLSVVGTLLPTGIGQRNELARLDDLGPGGQEARRDHEHLVDRLVHERGPHRERRSLRASSNVGLSDMPVNDCSDWMPRNLR